ncbi:MAG: hypothetical protein WA609_03585, partial [Terriglobales bacterium]
MPTEAQRATYKFIRDEIARLRSYVPLSLDQVSELTDCPESARSKGYLGNPRSVVALFRVGDARVFIEESGKVSDDGLPDCPRYANCLMRDFLPAVAADLLMEGNPHKPFLDLNSHTRE